MLAVVVSMRARADRIDEFLAAITTQAEASLRDESGCLQFDVLRLKDDPLSFLLYEIYVDEEAFSKVHRSTPHFARWNALAQELLETERTTTLAIPVVSSLNPEPS